AAKRRLRVVVAGGLLGLAGTGTVIALAQVPDPRTPGEPAPQVPNEPVPKKPTGKFELRPELDVTAFPDLKPPEFKRDPNTKKIVDKDDVFGDFQREYAKLCPRIFGGIPITVDPTDDTYRRLLKARLESGRLETLMVREVIMVGRWAPQDFPILIQCQDDMRAAATELWANDAKNLVPWLEE